MICSATFSIADTMESEAFTTPGRRLRWARERAGYHSAEDFAKALGLKPVTYRAYENDQNGFSRHAAWFGVKLGVTAEWLLEGAGYPDTDPPELPERDERALARELLDQLGLVQVREIPVSYAMGGGAILDDNAVTRFRTFDREWLRGVTGAPTEQLFFAKGDGDSMMPTILDEDGLLIHTGERVIDRQDRIWAMAYGGLGMVKRVRQLPSGRLLIISDNPTVDSFEADAQEIYVVGRVCWIGRRV